MKLDNHVKLEFNTRQEIKQIKSGTTLPESVIPPEILSYVKQNFSGKGIKRWQLVNNKQEVKLSNGVELEFSLDGKFLRIV